MEGVWGRIWRVGFIIKKKEKKKLNKKKTEIKITRMAGVDERKAKRIA